jgi:hypothetical protein
MPPVADEAEGAQGNPTDKESDDFVTKLRKVLPDLLDELLDLKGEAEPKEPARTTTMREREESVKEQVARAVRELEEEARHKKEHEELRSSTPPPPQQEVKPWRHRFWGDG